MRSNISVRRSRTHKRAITHAGNVFVPRDLAFRLSHPKIIGFPELIVEHYVSSLMVLAASVFEMSCRKTDRQTKNT